MRHGLAIALGLGVLLGASPARGAPASGDAPDAALFKIASAAYPVKGLDDLGLPGRSFDAARGPLEKILREGTHELGRGAQAAFLLGLLWMDPANPHADLDAARASFFEVLRLDPRSPEAPAALEAAALCLRLKGEAPAAAVLDVRLLAEHATDPAAARARVRLAREAGAQGDPALAARLLADDAGTGAPAEGRALAALLARASGDGPDAPGSRTLDARFEAPPVKEPVSLAVSFEGGLVALEGDSGRLVRAGDDVTTRAPLDPAPDAPRRRGVAVDPRGGLWIWDEKGVTPPDGARVEPLAPAKNAKEPERMKRIVAVAPGPMGTVDVIDGGALQVLRYGPGFVLRGIVALPSRPLAAARSEDGTLDVLLASRPRQVIRITAGPPAAAGWPARGPAEPAPTGWATSTITLAGPDGEMGSPVAIARDPLGHLYVLDDETRSVTVFGRDGRCIATIAPPRGSPGELRSPTALAVDGSGFLYIADRKLGRVVRFQ